VRRSYDAVLLDLDGTLVTDQGEPHPRTLARLRELHAAGIKIMLATGRSEGGTRGVLETLGFDTPAVVFNGAAVYSPVEDRLIEQRTLSRRAVQAALDLAEREDLLTVVMRAGAKFALPPRDEEERSALGRLEDLHLVAFADLPRDALVRVTFFSKTHGTSEELARFAEAAIRHPIYVTHFPLAALADHRASSLQVVDVQPPCRGKAEALRVLQELYGIPMERVIAVGDADNDIPMLRLAGLGIAMQNSTRGARSAARRVIGDNNSPAIACLLEELFELDGAGA
jgi:Cof subfamily protein (haloacid dehalogenase superfamily)